MNKPSRMSPFVFGLILGIVGTIFLPDYVRPYIPEWAMGKATVVKGTVVAKQKKEHVLLLTLDTADDALLTTFTKKVDEISLLVNEKDVIEFMLPKYAPFIDDPRSCGSQKNSRQLPIRFLLPSLRRKARRKESPSRR